MIAWEKMIDFFHAFYMIITNKIFYITFTSWFVAQLLKVIIHLIRFRKFDFRLFVGTGGMPSSHTSAVTAATVSVGMAAGWNSVIFMVCLMYCVVVISDAVGVRRASGNQAKVFPYRCLLNMVRLPSYRLLRILRV